MLLAEGKERFRNELRSSMRVMADDHSGGACSLGLQMDLGLVLQRGHDENYSDPPRQCPVQLDLLQPLMRPSDSSSGTAPDPSSTNNTTFSWQHHWNGSRTNSGSGYNDGEVETYSSGGHGTSPRGIDINQLPSTTECEEETVLSTSSPSSIGMMKRGRQEKCFHEFDLERERACDLSSRGGSDDEDGGTTRKKLRLSKEQSALLEESFKDHITLSPKQKSTLAKQLNLRPRQVEVWFQNRRARTKLKQTEVDCEMLKQCCETLTEENTRLQKELQELRAIKAAAPRVMACDFHMPLPAATLTMCPSCERVTTLDNQSVNFTKPKYPHFSHSPAAC
jgi:homeobox-leucine zipper protein